MPYWSVWWGGGGRVFNDLKLKSQSFNWPVSLSCELYQYFLALLPILDETRWLESVRVGYMPLSWMEEGSGKVLYPEEWNFVMVYVLGEFLIVIFCCLPLKEAQGIFLDSLPKGFDGVPESKL